MLAVFALVALSLSTGTSLPVLATPLNLATGVANGDFEQGRTAWTEYSKHGWPVIYDAGTLIVPPHSGQWAAWLGGVDDETSYIQQSIDVPTGGPILTYWFWISSEDECDAKDDSGQVRIDGDSVDTLRLCNTQSTLKWVERTVNLAAYAGQTVDLQIRVETNSQGNSNLFIDDVSLSATQRTLTITTVGQGTVAQAPAPPYYHDDSVKLTPQPASGWLFGGWTGPAATSLVDNGDGTWSLTMDGDKELTATFVPYRLLLPLVRRVY